MNRAPVRASDHTKGVSSGSVSASTTTPGTLAPALCLPTPPSPWSLNGSKHDRTQGSRVPTGPHLRHVNTNTLFFASSVSSTLQLHEAHPIRKDLRGFSPNSPTFWHYPLRGSSQSAPIPTVMCRNPISRSGVYHTQDILVHDLLVSNEPGERT